MWINGGNRKNFEDGSNGDSIYSTHQKRHSKDFNKVRQPTSPITRALQAAYLGKSQTASNEQTKEKRRSSNKRTRNSSRQNNKPKQSSKSESNQGNNKRGNGHAKNDNSILNYRTKNKVDVKSIKISRSSPTQPSTVLQKNKNNKSGGKINRREKEDYIAVTKPASMFVTSSNFNTSLTKIKASHKPQNWSNKKEFSSHKSSPGSLSKSVKGINPKKFHH